MSRSKSFLSLACALAVAGPAFCAQKAKTKIELLHGPTKAQLGQVAHIDVPEGYVFLDGAGYQAILKAEDEPVSGHELGYLHPTNQDWSVIFEFAQIGYVKDDDKDKLDADKLLASIKEGTAEANKQRARAGHPPIDVIGWDVPPRYNAETHNLEWAIRGAVEGKPLLNYNTRLLGRKGVMEVVLVVDPEQLAETLPTFRNLLSGYSYQSGQTYAEYRPGDKVAKYGLAALVVGGAAVGAAKLGAFAWLAVLFKKAWKLVVVVFAAIAGFFKKLFSGRKARTE